MALVYKLCVGEVRKALSLNLSVWLCMVCNFFKEGVVCGSVDRISVVKFGSDE